MDSGKIAGSPDPQAEIANKTAETIKDFFLPIDFEISPAEAAPKSAPKSALLTINPFNQPVNSKYFEK